MKYFKFYFLSIILAFCFLLPKGLYAESSPKIGFIDSQRIIDETVSGQKALEEMKKIKDENLLKLEKKSKEIESLETGLRKKEFVLTAEGKSEIEANIRQNYLELKKLKEEKEAELREIYLKNLKKIEREVIDIVQKIGREQSYTLILGRDESGIIFADPQIDLTDQVIKLYDQSKK